MASDLNRVILIGRLTRDPEYKNINGNSLVNFSIANNRTYVAGGDKREETHYFECESWGKLADIIRQYATKGKQVMVEGRLKHETWESDGKKNSRVRISVENLQLLGSGTGSGSSSQPYPDHQDEPPYPTSTGYPGRTGASGNPGGSASPSSGSQFKEYEPSDEEPF